MLNYKNRGFILIYVLFFSFFFSTVMLSFYDTDYFAEKLLHDRSQMIQRINVLKALQLSSIDDCIYRKDTESLSSKPLSWWKVHGCFTSFGGLKAYYLQQDLGINPCAIWKKNPNYIAHYHKIFMRVVNKEKTFLKSIYITVQFNLENTCQTDKFVVENGFQHFIE